MFLLGGFHLKKLVRTHNYIFFETRFESQDYTFFGTDGVSEAKEDDYQTSKPCIVDRGCLKRWKLPLDRSRARYHTHEHTMTVDRGSRAVVRLARVVL